MWRAEARSQPPSSTRAATAPLYIATASPAHISLESPCFPRSASVSCLPLPLPRFLLPSPLLSPFGAARPAPAVMATIFDVPEIRAERPPVFASPAPFLHESVPILGSHCD